VAAHSPYSSNVILSLSLLFAFSRGHRGDVSETSYIAGAEFSANGGSRRYLAICHGIGEGLQSAHRGISGHRSPVDTNSGRSCANSESLNSPFEFNLKFGAATPLAYPPLTQAVSGHL
jgi:hypothetical protein